MQGQVKTDRRYPLGDYKYVTFEDHIGNIPAELMLKQEFTNTARFIQLLGFEIVYTKYVQLKSHLGRIKDLEEVLQLLEKMKDDELKSLHKIINGVSLEDVLPQKDTPTLEDK